MTISEAPALQGPGGLVSGIYPVLLHRIEGRSRVIVLNYNVLDFDVPFVLRAELGRIVSDDAVLLGAGPTTTGEVGVFLAEGGVLGRAFSDGKRVSEDNAWRERGRTARSRSCSGSTPRWS